MRAFLLRHAEIDELEMEGKLGTITGKGFSSEIDVASFRHLNESVMHRRFHEDAVSGKPPLWTYTHTRLTDKFYLIEGEMMRITSDAAGAVVGCVVKEKLANMDFASTHGCKDLRISASRERKVPLPARLPPAQLERRKDRMSYRYDIWSVDLTRVESVTTSFEVEIELRDTALLRAEAGKERRGEPNTLTELAINFICQMRAYSV